MQLFTHLLSSYLQGMGNFFSALPRRALKKSPFFMTKTENAYDL